MSSLHIEHPITDLSTWTKAFKAFASARQAAGVVSERVSQPIDDDCYVMVDLDFDTTEHATGFLNFLRTQVWAVPENSPALAGTPTARVHEAVDLA